MPDGDSLRVDTYELTFNGDFVDMVGEKAKVCSDALAV